jgi:hypothetical protein
MREAQETGQREGKASAALRMMWMDEISSVNTAIRRILAIPPYILT